MDAIPEPWRNAPPALPEPPGAPGPLAALRDSVEAAFWRVLAFQHDGMAAEAEAAAAQCADCATRLRQTYDPHPALGPDAADATIAWAVHYARITFASDLKLERFRDWRVQRDRPKVARHFDIIADGQRRPATPRDTDPPTRPERDRTAD
jgi:hypothetical protein